MQFFPIFVDFMVYKNMMGVLNNVGVMCPGRDLGTSLLVKLYPSDFFLVIREALIFC